jgi:hypothetical protein
VVGGGSKVNQTIELPGLVTEAVYIPQLKKLLVTQLLQNVNTLYTYSHDDESCKLEEAGKFSL